MTSIDTTELPNWQERYNARFIVTARVRLVDQPGTLADLLTVVSEAGASTGDIKIVGADSHHKIRDVQLFLVSEARLESTIAAIRALDTAELLTVTDEVLQIHERGAIETRSRVPLNTMMDLRMVYTPGVASVCELIAEQPDTAWTYTAKSNRIAIATNGTAVLGLGDIGPLASLPVMEGKAAILAHFVGVTADPLLIDSKDIPTVIETVELLASQYGAIQLEDIAAPACFEIEQTLQERLDVPVFHDDQHGTATVVVAGLINALSRTGRTPADCRAVILGAGAAGFAIAKFLVEMGLEDVIVCDSRGTIHRDRSDLNPWKKQLAEITNREGVKDGLAEAVNGRELFVGASRPNTMSSEMVRSMAKDPIVFALANPVSEISVEDALEAGASIAMDGRGMNNALAYPGIFRGALDARAKRITESMKLAAAETLAAAATDGLLPEMLDHDMHARVAEAVAAEWVNA